MLPKDVYFAIILATVILLLVVFFIVIFVLYFFKIKRQVFYEKELLKKDINETVIKSQLEIQEQTLQTISRELHDNLGQIASLIKINLNTLQFTDINSAKNKIEDTKALTRQLIADIRSLSTTLNSDRIVEIGLAKSLEILAGQLNKTGQFTVSYEEKGELPLINDDTLIILYRMVQEVVNNVIKHSGAKRVSISLIVDEKNITLELGDDGIGFDLNDRANKDGNGLRNLKKRASHINAEITIRSGVQNGCTITIRLPYI